MWNIAIKLDEDLWAASRNIILISWKSGLAALTRLVPLVPVVSDGCDAN